MHIQRKTKWITATIAVFIAAIIGVVGFGLAMSSSHFGDRNKDALLSSNGVAAAPDPRREYSGITVENVDGLVVYSGLTTAGDLKNNIVVYGSYNGNDVALSASEYMISIDDEIVADDDKISDLVFDGTTSISFSVTTGTRTAAFPRALDIIADAPVFDENTVLSVELPAGVTSLENNHTIETIKKLLIVSYTDGSADAQPAVIANKELYELTIGADISTATAVTITATIKDTAISGSSDPIPVKRLQASDIVGISISVKNSVALENGTWVRSDGSHAFVLGASKGRALESLDVYVQYAQTEKLATIVGINASTGEGIISGIDGITSCIITNSDFTGASSQIVNINVRNGNVIVGSASVSLTFETRRIISITAEHVGGELSSDMAVSASEFALSGKYNDNEPANISGDNVTIFPDSYAPTAADMGSDTYSKEFVITLNSDSNISTKVVASGIKYIAPSGIVGFGIDNGNQEIMKPFDFSKAYANVEFNNDGWETTQKVYLDEFYKNGQITINNYYNSNRQVISNAVDENGRLISMDISSISITATIGSAVRTGNIQGITVNPADISVPKISTTRITYSDGCYKQIRGIDFSRLAIDGIELQSLSVEITKDDTIGSLKIDYSRTGEPSISAADSFPANFDPNTGRLTFKSGGVFHVSLRLTENGNFRWEQYEPTNTHWSQYNYIYDLEIGKADIEARLDNGGKPIELTYGQLSATDGTFTGWNDLVKYRVVGSSVDIENSNNRPEFKLYFYGFDGKVFSDDIADLTTLCKLDVNDSTTPYHVVVYAEENDAYNATKIFESNAAQLIVKPKELAVGAAITNQDYDRYEYTLDDFVNVPSTGFWEYSDTDSILNVESVAFAGAADKPAEGYIHVNTYGAKLTLRSKNYIWTGETGKTADNYSYINEKFEIKKISFSFDSNAVDFIYGDTENNGPAHSPASFGHKAYKKTDSANVTTNISESDFFPQIQAVAYYTEADFDTATNKPNATATALVAENSDTWNVGKYYVFYSTAYGTDGSITDTSVDYDLPTAYASFKISPREVKRVTIESKTPTYDGNDIDFALNDYFGTFMTFGTLDSGTLTTGKAVGVTTDPAKPVTVTGLNTSNAFVTVKHAASYTVWVSFGANADNYVWKPDTASGSATPDNDPIELTFEVKQSTLNISDDSGSTAGVDPSYVPDSYDFRFKGDGVEHGKPAFVATNAYAADGVAIIYTVTKDGNSVADSALLTLGVGEYDMELDFTVSGAGALKTDYVLPVFGLPDGFRVLAAELMFPSLKGSDAGETPAVKVEDGKLIATYKGARYDISKYLQSNTDGLSTLAGLDISTDKAPIDADTYTITVKPTANYSWADGQTYNGNSTTDEANKQLEITFAFVIVQKKVTVAWSDASLTTVYNGTAQKPTASVTSGEIYSRDTVSVVVSVGADITDAIDNGGENGQAKIDAGSYIAVAYKLTGTGTDNYEIDIDDVDYGKSFVINKQKIVKPESVKGITFGDSQSGVSIGRVETAASKGWAWLFDTAATYPAVTATISAKNSSGADLAAHGATFVGTDGKFTYQNAGTYTITLTVGDTDNYCWVDDTDPNNYNKSTTEIVVTIDKKSLTAPTASATATFDETAKTVNLVAGAGTTWAGLVKNGTFDPNVTGITVGTDFFGDELSNSGVNVSNGRFVYVDAGNYTVTLTIGASNNFYWGSDKTADSVDIAVTVNRKSIASPTIASPYTIDWTGSAVCPDLATAPGIEAAKYDISYGSVSISGKGPDKTISYNGNYSDYQSVDRGEYFIKFTLKKDSDGFNYKNYVWTAPYGAGSESGGEYVERKGHLEITKDETAVYLHYAITNALLQVEFEFDGFTFGDNFADSDILGALLKPIDDVGTPDTDEAETFKAEMQNGRVQIEVSFAGTNPANNGSFVWNKFDAEQDGETVAFNDRELPWNACGFYDVSNNLVNYLPLNADTYTVTMVLTYSAASTYQGRTVTTTLTIDPFKISVDWKFEGKTDADNAFEIDYDGNTHAPIAEISNAPMYNGASTADGLSLTVGTDVGSNTLYNVKNADDYTFYVIEIAGTPESGNLASNFSLDDVVTAQLKIKKLDLTVTPNAAGHTYGDEFGSGTAFSLSSDGFIDAEINDGENLFDYVVYNKTDVTETDLSGNKLTPVSSAAVEYVVALRSKASATAVALLSNYNITYGDPAAYTIAKRNVTVTITGGLSSVYGTEPSTPTVAVTSDNEVGGETDPLLTLHIYESGTTPITKYSNVGKYAVVKDDNSNYIVTLDKAYEYEIQAATLYVSVELEKHYGEKVPDDFKTDVKYLLEKSEAGKANTGIYNITGFVSGTKNGTAFNDEDLFYAQSDSAHSIDGSIAYSISGTTITVTVTDLAWGNYVFVGQNGTLTVGNLAIVVTVNEQSVTYYDNANIPDLAEKGVGFDVSYPDSSFGLSEIEFEDGGAPDFAALFELNTAATVGGKTNNVGKYDIVADDKTSVGDNYDITFKDVGSDNTYVEYYEILPATLLNVATLSNFTSAFKQADITPNVANGVVFADTVDKADKATTASVKYLIANGDDEPSDTDWNGAASSMPSFYHAGAYKVYYLIYADNHAPVVKSFDVTVSKAANNAFTSTFNYEGKAFGAVADISSQAWEYGSYKTYDAHAAFVEPATTYYIMPNGDEAPILVTLYYSADGSAWGTALYNRAVLAHGAEIYTLLEGDWSIAQFNAGYYKFVFEMDETDNYSAPSPDERYLSVSKATLTVTPTGNYSTTYGESFDGLDDVTYSVTGFVLGQNKSVVSAALDAIVWTTDYAQGAHATNAANAYIIEIDDDSADKYSTQNYVLTFNTVGLTVDKRVVTISIADQWVYYNLYSHIPTGQTNAGMTEIVVDGLYTVTSDVKFYADDKPITLFTDAYSIVDGAYKTNNVGNYPIYAKFNGTFVTDYDIRFGGCSFGGTLPSDAITATGNSAGTFEIRVSTILADIAVTDKEYDGDPIVAGLTGFDSNDKVKDLYESFDAVYYKAVNHAATGEALDYVPTNAGEYFVEFVYAPADPEEADNYRIYTMGRDFRITKIKLTIRVDTFETFNPDNNMSIVYGSAKPAANAVESGNGFGGLKYTLHYNDNANALTEAQIAEIAEFELAAGNKWDVSALRFDIPSYYVNTAANSSLNVEITHYFDTTNFEFNYRQGRIMVIPREITITMSGVDQLAAADKALAQGVYLAGQNDRVTHIAAYNAKVKTALAKFFAPEPGWAGSSGDTLTALNLAFAFETTQTAALDVGKYAIRGTYGNSNYSVTFAVPDEATDGKVYYEVTPAALTVKTVVTDAVTNAASPAIYGNDIVVSYVYSGFLVGQNYVDLSNDGVAGGSVIYDETVYTPWISGVSSYTIIHEKDETDALWFKNYAVSFEACTFDVIKRVITVDDIESAIYKEEADRTYNGGDHGMAQHAVIKFSDSIANRVINGVSGDAENSYGLPARGVGYAVSYAYAANASETYTNGKAPDKAGEYNVTITLTAACGNYRFATSSVSKKYVIDKQEIGLNWNNGAVDFENNNDDAKRYIANFKPDIMSVVSFYRFSTDSEDVQEDTIEYVAYGSYDPVGVYMFYTYNAADEKLHFKAYSAGYYTVRIELNMASRRNYYINGNVDTYDVALRLVATTDHIEFFELRMDGNSWVYGEPEGNLVIDTSAASSGFAITYAMFNRGALTWNELWATFDPTSEYMAVSGFDSADGLSIASFTPQMPVNVGVYVLRAYYSPTGQSRYCLFRITPKSVAVPTINGGAERNYTYTGSALVFDITGYNSQSSVNTGSLNAAPITGGIRVGATNVGSYPISVAFTTENYVWSTESLGKWTRNSDSVISVNWTISQAQESIAIEGIERDYDGDNSYGDPSITTKFGGSVTIRYAEKKDGVADAALTGWSTEKPSQVGTYAIRASVDGTSNYLGDTKYETLVISPVELIVTPYGSMIYGATFAPNGTSTYGIRYGGFVGNDNESNVEFSGAVTYDIDRKGAQGLLDAKTYVMTVDVSGYSTRNYTIVGVNGEFVVTPKKIDVKIIGSSSTYGTAVSVSDLVSSYAVTGYDIAPDLLGITPALVGVDDYARLDARSYSIIAADYTNGNFDITFTPGTFTVDPLRITIGAIEVGDGEVDVISAPRVTSWIWHGANDAVGTLTAAQAAELVYDFAYTDSVSGAAIEWSELKATVGSYYVLVTQTNGNYRLVGQTTYGFRVLARTIDGSLISVANLPFNDSVQVPVIDFGDYNESLFDVTYLGDRTNVGTHYVILSLGDNPNYSWSESTSREYRIPFEIVRGDNSLVSLEIAGWVYGEYDRTANAPMAVTRFGNVNEYIFNYYSKNGDAYELLTGVPVNAGTYYITVTVPLAPNYNAFTSDYVSFVIAKAKHAVPTLGIVTEGAGKNDTYTGEALAAVVQGFDSTEMSIHYDGISNINGNIVTVYATDADTYTIKLALRNDGNYSWTDNVTLDEDGYAVLTWTIAKKKVAVPTDNTGSFVVNGSTLVYIPNGFDASIMDITGNTTSYGGTFRVTVTLKDTNNYEWEIEADGVIRNAYDFTWNVVGADTVFGAVMGVLGGLVGAAAIAVLVQFLIHRKRISEHNAATATAGHAHAAGEAHAEADAATSTDVDADNASEGE